MKNELLAPNGKPSNLTPEQYKLVRTPAFKSWFGDWEQNPKNASKIIDDNGEPLVLYHGTDVKFNQFDLTKIGEGSDLLGKGIYLTENRAVANFYANFVAKKRYIKGYEEGILGTENPVYESDASEKAKKHEVLYEFFVNAKNKISINEMNVDDNLKKIFIESIRYMFGDTSEEIINSRIDFANQNSSEIRNYRGIVIYLMEQFPESKNEVVKYIKSKYDCIVFDPTSDFESDFKDYKNYVVYSSNQVKLADGTNITFDLGNDDIRYAIGGEVNAGHFIVGKKYFYKNQFMDEPVSLKLIEKNEWSNNEIESLTFKKESGEILTLKKYELKYLSEDKPVTDGYGFVKKFDNFVSSEIGYSPEQSFGLIDLIDNKKPNGNFKLNFIEEVKDGRVGRFNPSKPLLLINKTYSYKGISLKVNKINYVNSDEQESESDNKYFNHYYNISVKLNFDSNAYEKGGITESVTPDYLRMFLGK